jgi:hypothetical protein
MFTIEQSWGMSEQQKVLAIVRKLGLWRLGNLDGCCCCSFQIRNISVEVSCGSCGKGMDRGVRVSSKSMDFTRSEQLLLVAEEVKRQLEECDGRGDAPITIDVGG